MQKLLKTRQKTYESHPYKRLTKEWFIWRYPGDGLQRFNDHVNKSRQSEENMIKRYGEKLGKKKWEETVQKKNTLSILKAKGGEKALLEWKEKRNKGYDAYWDKLSEQERQQVIKNRTKKSKVTKRQRYGNKKKIEIFKEKYGEDGSVEYAKYLQTIFKSIGYSKECEKFIKDLINSYPILQQYTLFYRDQNNNKVEWFLTDGNNIFFYDLCIKERMILVEYDGSKWHPTYDQYLNNPDDIMEIIGMSVKEKFEKDQNKILLAEQKGYTIFVVRSDMSKDEINRIILDIIHEVS